MGTAEGDDIQVVNLVQVIPVQVTGEWDLRKRQSIFHIFNLHDIENAYNAL